MAKKLVVFILLLVLISAAASAEEPQETVAVPGTIQDATGASIPGAKVKLTPQSGGHETEVTTDETGAFSFDNQPAGDYTLTVVAQGFKLAERKLTVGYVEWRSARGCLHVH